MNRAKRIADYKKIEIPEEEDAFLTLVAKIVVEITIAEMEKEEAEKLIPSD